MRYISFFLLLISGYAFSEEITLMQGNVYTVPDSKLWEIANAPAAGCDICTADVYIDGDVSNVEMGGVIFHGSFDFSFKHRDHSVIRLYPGTQIRLGDSRETLIIRQRQRP